MRHTNVGVQGRMCTCVLIVNVALGYRTRPSRRRVTLKYGCWSQLFLAFIVRSELQQGTHITRESAALRCYQVGQQREPRACRQAFYHKSPLMRGLRSRSWLSARIRYRSSFETRYDYAICAARALMAEDACGDRGASRSGKHATAAVRTVFAPVLVTTCHLDF
jgi:hypothetical protein